ncbi:AP endonuclease 2, partial [Geosmithia morbida]
MGFRITTWNGMSHSRRFFNGIRNPFSYQPWCEKRTFQDMFEILEADIVVMQETKIQRKDLRDDMVLVPGWDVYFSLPRHKKEGITGILPAPKSTVSFRDLPEDQQIGGYPRAGQLSGVVDEMTLDSEGRCVILEFPAFVLLGVYSPANRDESRDDFRLGYLEALDMRVRNLVAMGKEVILTGDLNVIRSELDSTNMGEQLRKAGVSVGEWLSTPSRRLFNHLIFEGSVQGPRDEGREEGVLWDICRCFHPDREGMNTCWDTRRNTRPANNGSRIDYVLGRDWGEHGYSEEVSWLLDLVNPPGMFKDGRRQIEWSQRHLLPLSAKLIPEFDKRRSIRDMFTKKTTAPPSAPTVVSPSLSPATGPSVSLTRAPSPSTRHAYANITSGERRIKEDDKDKDRGGQEGTAAAGGGGGVEAEEASQGASQRVGSGYGAAGIAADSAASATGVPDAKVRLQWTKRARASGDRTSPVKAKRAKASAEVGGDTNRAKATTPGPKQRSIQGFFKPKNASASTIGFSPSSGAGAGAKARAGTGVGADATKTAKTCADVDARVRVPAQGDAQTDPDADAGETANTGTNTNASEGPSSGGGGGGGVDDEDDDDDETNNVAADQSSPSLGTQAVVSSEADSEGGRRRRPQNGVVPTQGDGGDGGGGGGGCEKEDEEEEEEDDRVFDPIEAKESWSKLLGKRVVPRCEHHGEPCISLVTKKPGINCG